MKTPFLSTYTYDQIDQIIERCAPLLKNQQIITFTGGLGAGKTTFIRHLLVHWGIQESAITSPTFTYVNIYQNAENIIFYHFDLYRLHTVQEFMMAGFHEYIHDTRAQSLIEWPELIMDLAKTSVAHCLFEYGEQENERKLTIQIDNE
ncbi:MAG TPA: tRNA (adenosine(37)-N6)-threonylcarbamoyltransferase complex ATPase subunit type 1 TsaE [Patescibacteria group bacterium]|jgi:tRNA threonylcarbamoyladenosine biosynthesis protein TsaE|nr:tRNA (adenosine(37)-N6)-threonylcarbamoyltransferase complex ATPase subunit type 1 TsaE [Patescibacteria group bacterium]